MAGPIDAAYQALGDIDEYRARAGQNPQAQAAVERVRGLMGGAAPAAAPAAAAATANPGWLARNLPTLAPYGADASSAAGLGARAWGAVAPVARFAGGAAALMAVPGVIARTYDEVADPNSASSRATLPYRQAADQAGGLAGVLPRMQAVGVGTASIANQAVLQPLLRAFGSRVAQETASPVPAAPAAAAAPAARPQAEAPRTNPIAAFVAANRGTMTAGQLDSLLGRIPSPLRPPSSQDAAGYLLLEQLNQQQQAINQMPTGPRQQAAQEALRRELLGVTRSSSPYPMLNMGVE